MKVLVAEKLADSGIEALRAHFDVDVETDCSPEQLAERIGEYDGLLIRSATQVTADLIARADRLKVVGRAGIGVDNVDVDAATKRGIVVANAPQSNIVAAAEHTIALMLAVARNIPRAHASLTAGKWERSQLAGAELYEKTLGILGFGRIGQLVAARARGFQMHVLAYDPYRERGALPRPRRRERGVGRRRLRRRRLPHRPPAADARDRAGFSTPRRSPSARTAWSCSTSRAASWWSTRTSRKPWTRARSAAPASTSSARSPSRSTRCSATPTS